MIVNVNLGLGGAIKEVENYICAAQDKAKKAAAEKRLRAPHDNAVFVAAIADAVYCITTDDNTPHIFTCCKKTMPNQFSMSMEPAFINGGSQKSPKERKFELHQRIMADALSKNFEYVLILEPGVDLMNIPNLAGLSDIHKVPFNFAVLGGLMCVSETFSSTLHPLLESGCADRIDAFVVSKSFMQKMVAVDPTLLMQSTDTFYHECPNAVCMIPLPFENTQLSTMLQVCTKFLNTYRSYFQCSLTTIMILLIALYLILWLVFVLLQN